MRIEPLTGKALDSRQHSTASINLYEGSVRSGKTVTTIIDWLDYCRNGPEGPLLMAGKTQRTIENNLIYPIQEMIGPARCSMNRGTGTLQLLGRTVYVTGANNEAARTKIQGLTLAGALLDEAGTVPESFFNMLYSRLSIEGAQMWATSNPEGPAHWLKTKWLDRARLWIDLHGAHHVDLDGIDLHRFTFGIDDNPNLPASYVERIKKSYTGLWYRRYIEAAWVAAEGAVYDFWDPDIHVVGHGSLPAMSQIISVGVDHGTTNASAAVLLGIGVDGVLYAIDEWWSHPEGHQAKLTVEQQSTSLRAWMDSHPPARFVVVDPAAAAFRAQLFHDGVRNVQNAENDVAYGISTVASLLTSGKLKVSSRCRHLIMEFPSYVWDDKASERGEDKPVKVADHVLDSLRYSVSTTESIWRRRLNNTAA